MLKIRLTRVGSKKNPIYRVVVADSRSPRDGARDRVRSAATRRRSSRPLIEIDADRATHWLAKGAQPSEPVRVLLKKQGIV